MSQRAPVNCFKIGLKRQFCITSNYHPFVPPAGQTATRNLHSCSPAQSHIGSLPIPYPPSVSISIIPSTQSISPPSSSSEIQVVGPKGSLTVPLMPFVTVLDSVTQFPSSAESNSISPSTLQVLVADSAVKHQRAVWGLTRSLIANAVQGVASGFTLELRLVGVGYRVTLETIPGTSHSPNKLTSSNKSDSAPSSQRLNFKLGYAHPVFVDLPPDVTATTPSTTTIILSGIDKQRLGEVAARIRRWRQPEPYNGKGIFVGEEEVRRKERKKR
ncbi:ribosomal protein L6 [Meredithblackwellia eburnea MCA 4105]